LFIRGKEEKCTENQNNVDLLRQNVAAVEFMVAARKKRPKLPTFSQFK